MQSDHTKDSGVIPYNLEAEQNIIGLILSNNENLNLVADVIKEEYFYLPIHGKIYSAINKLYDRNLIADPVTIKNYFVNDPTFKAAQVDTYKYLIKLVKDARLGSDIKTLLHVIYDSHMRRKIIGIGESCIIRAREEKVSENADELLEYMEQEIYNLASTGNREAKFSSLEESIKKTILSIEFAKKNNKFIRGVDTGYDRLNELTGGFHNTDLIIIAARPSMGKTALSINISINAAKQFLKRHKDGIDSNLKSVCFFSLEMSSEQVASRVLSVETKIDGSKIRFAKVTQEEFKTISKSLVEIGEIPIMIDDTPALTISAIRTRARRMKRQYNMGLLVVDYLQLINSTRRNDNRVQEIAEISQGLKAIAKELDIPVVAASQLSRAVETREDKRPILSDLRESGNIEQDADLVMFIYREEYYLERKKPSDEQKQIEWQENKDRVENLAEIMIAKQRNGPVGNVNLRFSKSTTAFDNLA